jgi:hypothetical protein
MEAGHMGLVSDEVSEGLTQSCFGCAVKLQIELLLGEEGRDHEQIKIENANRILDEGIVANDFINAHSIHIIHLKIKASYRCSMGYNKTRPFLPFPSKYRLHSNRLASNRMRNERNQSFCVQEMELATQSHKVESIVYNSCVIDSSVFALRAIQKQVDRFLNIP